MGVVWDKSVPSLLLVICCVCGVVAVAEICLWERCECITKAETWVAVRCDFNETQEVIMGPGLIQGNVGEVHILSGYSLVIGPGAVSTLYGLTSFHVQNVSKVYIEKKSFVNTTTSSLAIQIEYCDLVTIKTGAFDDMQGSLEVAISNVNSITLEQSAFSKLIASRFSDVKMLNLSEGAFEFKHLAILNEFGISTKILFDKVYIPKIPQGTFLSSLAELIITNCLIESIESLAFKATQINNITIYNTMMDEIKKDAITERSLIVDLVINKCNISKIESKAVTAGMTHLTVNNSIIMEIYPEAVISTVANVMLHGNEIGDFGATGFKIKDSNRITVQNNVIKQLHSNFIHTSTMTDIKREIIFTGNQLHGLDTSALGFVSDPEVRVVIDDNYFNKLCSCHFNEWLQKITSSDKQVDDLMQTSFCSINELYAKCLNLSVSLVNVDNFTEIMCKTHVECKPYNGETRTVNTTSKIFNNNETNLKTWVILFALVILVVILIVASLVIFLIRGSRWLKRKGYFRNIHYNQNETSCDDENTMVTVDTNEKLEIPEELTVEFLHDLSRQLDDPATHQQAAECIIALYEMFIVDDNYDAKQEDAHLYEELGNLNLQIPPPPYEQEEKSNGARSILKLMEEKFNLQTDGEGSKPALTGEYSEPSDAAVHLYSELKQGKDQKSKSSLESVMSRPLPEKPDESFSEAGPSTKF